jgi:hypothetical protein
MFHIAGLYYDLWKVNKLYSILKVGCQDGALLDNMVDNFIDR